MRLPSQESMASTETYHSNASSMVHVQPQGGANAGYEDDDDDDKDHWHDDEDVEKSMPSHHFRSIRGLPSENAFKQGMRRTLKKRVHGSRGSVRSLSYDGTDDGSSVYEDEVLHDVQVNLTAEEFAELTKRRKSIKEMPTSIRRKRSLRYELPPLTCLSPDKPVRQTLHCYCTFPSELLSETKITCLHYDIHCSTSHTYIFIGINKC